MNWAWQQKLSPTPKLILMALADAANEYGVCWPSVSTVATRCCVSIRTVRRVMQTLVDRGLLHSEQRYRTDGSCSSNRHRSLLEGGDKLSPAPDARDRTPGQPQGCELTMAVMRQGRTKGRAGRYQANPNTSFTSNFTGIASLLKAAVLTLAVWNWFPAGLADRISCWGGSHHD